VRLEDVGKDRVVTLARAVLASSKSSPVLPRSIATISSVEPIRPFSGDTVLQITFEVHGRTYWYLWPEESTPRDESAHPQPLPVENYATVVLANLAELLEGAECGLDRALERGLIREAEPSSSDRK
jgi:hypothetical protein